MAFRDLMESFSIPMVLMILLAVYVGFSGSTTTFYEETVLNETVGTDAGTHTTAYDAVANTTAAEVAIYNSTMNCSNCTIAYSGLRNPATVVAGSDVVGDIIVTYIGLSRSGYTSFEAIDVGAQSGFNLASMLPFAIVGFLILGIVLKYLGVV